MDPWWNPAVVDQAADRVHRIGQLRPVTIYRFITRGTIEDKILALHATKRDLADHRLEGTDTTGRLSAEELLALIRERGFWLRSSRVSIASGVSPRSAITRNQSSGGATSTRADRETTISDPESRFEYGPWTHDEISP